VKPPDSATDPSAWSPMIRKSNAMSPKGSTVHPDAEQRHVSAKAHKFHVPQSTKDGQF